MEDDIIFQKVSVQTVKRRKFNNFSFLCLGLWRKLRKWKSEILSTGIHQSFFGFQMESVQFYIKYKVLIGEEIESAR